MQSKALSTEALVQVADALALAKQGNRLEAEKLLGELPAQEVIIATLPLLEVNHDDSPLAERQLVLWVLKKHGAARQPNVSTAIARIATDYELCDDAIVALIDAPFEHREGLVRLFDGVLRDAKSPITCRMAVATVASNWKGLASLLFPQLVLLLHNEREDERARGLYAQAILAIRPISDALEVLRESDAKATLGPIGKMGVETQGTFNSAMDERDRVRNFVRNACFAPDRETRVLAFETLAPSYGHDFAVQDEFKNYVVNPSFRDTVERMAREEPDEDLRARAISVVQTLDQRLTKMVRRLEKLDKTAP